MPYQLEFFLSLSFSPWNICEVFCLINFDYQIFHFKTPSMFNHCRPIIINNLYGLLTINTTDSSSCTQPRQWYFFYDYGYTLLIRLINIAHVLSNSFVFKIYSTTNKEKILVYDSTSTSIVNNQIQLDIETEYPGVLLELIPSENPNIQQTSIVIDYVFRTTSHSRYGRQILQDNSGFSASQPAFIALITIIAILVLAIIIAIVILCYRHCSHRKHSEKRRKTRRVPPDQARVGEWIIPSSTSSYSNRSTQHLFPNHHPIENPQQTSLGQSNSTVPSIMPSRRLQQSMMDAYLNDFHALPPQTIDPKQLNPYLFIDLHSTSSETFPDVHSKKNAHDNTTTSGYDTSTGGEEKHRRTSLQHHHRRRRRSYHHQRQRRRSALALKRSNGPRFLMRERSLPNNLIKLPQLRQEQNHLFDFRENRSSSTISNNTEDLISTNLSLTTDDYDESHAYHINPSCIMDTIEEEKPSISHQPYFFEMVSTHRGDESDMPTYDDDLRLTRNTPSSNLGDGIAYVNDSILV